MAFSSSCFVVVFVAILLQFILVSASTKPIDAICHHTDAAFCVKTLTAYPPAVSATDLLSLANIVIDLGISYANNTGGFAAETANKELMLKTQFNSCELQYEGIQLGLTMGKGQLKEDPNGANYDIMRCLDCTVYVRELIGGNRDSASKTLMWMTLQMDKFINMAVGATIALEG